MALIAQTLVAFVGQQKRGISLSNIRLIARSYYMNTFASFLSFVDLKREVTLPCIVHWNQEHFIVVYKIKKHNKGQYTVYVADPGKGLITYTKEEFCEHWVGIKTNGEEKGVALLLEPTELFYTQRNAEAAPSQNRIKFLWTNLKNIDASSHNLYLVCC